MRAECAVAMGKIALDLTVSFNQVGSLFCIIQLGWACLFFKHDCCISEARLTLYQSVSHVYRFVEHSVRIVGRARMRRVHFAWKISNNWACVGWEEYLLHSLFEKSQIRKDNDNRPSTAMNFEISVDIGSVCRQVQLPRTCKADTFGISGNTRFLEPLVRAPSLFIE